MCLLIDTPKVKPTLFIYVLNESGRGASNAILIEPVEEYEWMQPRGSNSVDKPEWMKTRGCDSMDYPNVQK